ncbi:MAG TPA: OPT/YSL family transporter, partial [Edaphobacter sp.]
FKPVPGAQVGWGANLAASLLIIVFGFLFVTVSARIVGIVGSSASPVSGMTIATLMATAAIFLVKGWTAPAFGALAITIGGIVCIAASNAGDTAQDLKTGYLIGATPWKQQLAIMIGVIISVLSISTTLNAMNKGLESFQRLPKPIALSLSALPDGVQSQGSFTRDRVSLTDAATSTHTELTNTRSYILLNAIGSSTLADGKYLYNPATQQIEVQWTQGIGSEKAAAPQGRLMATVINGILSRKLPWSLVLLGVALVIMIELLGVRSLTLAVGAYLSIGTTLAIFVGGVIRWMVDRAAEKAGAVSDENEEISSGSLFASGLIAAGGIVGLLGVAIKLYESATDRTIPRFSETNPLHHDWVSVLMFGLLAYSLYYFARKPLDNSDTK